MMDGLTKTKIFFDQNKHNFVKKKIVLITQKNAEFSKFLTVVRSPGS